MIESISKILLTSLLLSGTAIRASSAGDDWVPLKVGTENGRGPFALPNVNHSLMGAVFVYGSKQPDLFVAGFGGERNLWLAKWKEDDADGVPVFEPPILVDSPFSQRGSIFQTSDGVVRAVWIDRDSLELGVFDLEQKRFEKTRSLSLDGFPRTPVSVSVMQHEDESFDLVFELPDGAAMRSGDPWSPDWRPYDAAGIWTGEMPYRYLFTAKLSSLDAPSLSKIRMASATEREVLANMYRTTPVTLKEGRPADLVSGSRMGNLYFFPRISADVDGLRFERRVLIQGTNGVAIRNPFCSVGVIAFPDPETGLSNLIAAGEGGLQFYRYTGEFRNGAPVFAEPRPVLQESADLYAGSLPVPSVVDWDGDGILDIVAGNSEGLVLFFKNLGDNENPKFAPGTPISAGGKPIQVQAGYSGSVQGVWEARWGYVSPNVADWTGNGLPDIIMGDITGNYSVYINRGTRTEPKLDPAVPIYCDGLDLHGQWRVRPAVAQVGDQTFLVTVDDDDHLHLYRRVDNQNVESVKKLRLTDGSLISASSGHGGMKGRCKLSLFDWDGDGALDMVISTARHNAIPNTDTGLPKPTLGERPQGVVMFMRNAGTSENPVFEHPVPFMHRTAGIVHPGGAHESGTVATNLGGNGPNLLAGNETGRFMLLRRENLRTGEK